MRRSEKFKSILRIVSSITEIDDYEILSQDRHVDVCLARNIFFLVCKEQGLQPTIIMRLCKDNGWKNIAYSTVSKNIEKAMLNSDKEFKTFLDEVRRDI